MATSTLGSLLGKIFFGEDYENIRANTPDIPQIEKFPDTQLLPARPITKGSSKIQTPTQTPSKTERFGVPSGGFNVEQYIKSKKPSDFDKELYLEKVGDIVESDLKAAGYSIPSTPIRDFLKAGAKKLGEQQIKGAELGAELLEKAAKGAEKIGAKPAAKVIRGVSGIVSTPSRLIGEAGISLAEDRPVEALKNIAFAAGSVTPGGALFNAVLSQPEVQKIAEPVFQGLEAMKQRFIENAGIENQNLKDAVGAGFDVLSFAILHKMTKGVFKKTVEVKLPTGETIKVPVDREFWADFKTNFESDLQEFIANPKKYLAENPPFASGIKDVSKQPLPEGVPPEKPISPELESLTQEARKKGYYTNVFSGAGYKTNFVKAPNAKSVPNNAGLDLFVSKNKDGLWVVSEAKSGKAFTRTSSTKQGAINLIEESLQIAKDRGVDISKTINEAVSKHGISPRYQAVRGAEHPSPAQPLLEGGNKIVKVRQDIEEAKILREKAPEKADPLSDIKTQADYDRYIQEVETWIKKKEISQVGMPSTAAEIPEVAKMKPTEEPIAIEKPTEIRPSVLPQPIEIPKPALSEAERITETKLASDKLYQKTGVPSIVEKKIDTTLKELPKEPTKWGRIKENIGNFATSFKEKIVSDWQRVKELEMQAQKEGIKLTSELTPYERRKLLAGRQTAKLKETEEVITKIDRDILDTSKKLKIPDKDLQKDIFDFLRARHTPERNKVLGEKAAGITDIEAKAILDRIEQSPNAKEIKRIGEDLQKYHNETLDILYAEGQPWGVIDKQLYDTLRTKYKNHIPLNRIMDTDNIGDVLSGRGLAVKGTGLKRAKGSEREIKDIMENIYSARTQAIQRVEKNIVDNETYQFVEDYVKTFPEQELFSIEKPPIVPIAKVEIRETIDKGFMDELSNFARSLGAKVETKGIAGQRLGYFQPVGEKVVRHITTPRETLAHEIGHFFDNKFKLKQRFYKRGVSKPVAEEMLAHMKRSGESLNRMKKTEERFADAFEWWMTHRDLAEQQLPLFSKEMTKIISDVPELKKLLDIKPTAGFTVEKYKQTIFREKPELLYNDPTILQLQRNGQPTYIRINDPRLAVALRGVNREQIPALMRYVGTVTRWMSSLATRFSAEFPLANKIRDLQEAMIYMGAHPDIGFKGAFKMVAKDPASIKAVKDALFDIDSEGAKLYKQMVADGGTTGGLALSTRQQVETSLDSIRKTARSNPRKAFETLIKGFDGWNTLFEDSTRLSAYRQALKQGLSREKAAIIAKNVSIDFNEFGTWGPLINSMYMFANASVRGSAKMMQAMRNPKVATAVVGTVGASVFAANSWNDEVDPEWRTKVSKWDKLNSLNIAIPGTKEFYYVAIPVSWGIKPIKVIMEYGSDLVSGEHVDTGDIIYGTLSSAIEAYNPVGGTDWVSTLTPSPLDPFVDIARNKKWSGQKIRPEAFGNYPLSTRYFKDLKDSKTGEMLIGITKELSKVTGGRIEISPADAEYILEQVTGGPGKFTNKVFNTISAIGEGKKPEIRDVPFLSRLLRKVPKERWGTTKGELDIDKFLTEDKRKDFYRKEEAETIFEEMKKMPVIERKDFYLQLKKENPNLLKKVDKIASDEEKGLTQTERKILQLSVEDGERAKYLFKVFQSAKAQEKEELYLLYKEKGIITKKVKKQLDYLFAQ